MKRLIWLMCCWPIALFAQENNKGIQWTEGLTWEQVKVKAREENKYIFIDCYATWCRPCKAMETQVYPLDSIGEYFNDKFISVKVQMDVTKNDKAAIITWRKEAEQIRKKFSVDGFPTFLFFSSEGVLIHKTVGFQAPGDFLAAARTATRTGQVYVDPLEYNNRLMEDYRKGKYPPDSAFALHEFFRVIRDNQKAQIIEEDLYEFLTRQPTERLFTPDRLKFIASITSRNTDRWFLLFYQQAKRVNRVMKDDNYSGRLVGGIILNNVVTPFLKMDMSGRMMANPEVAEKKNKKEADWTSLRKEIRKQFNEYYTKRSMLAARFTWYQLHMNTSAFANTYLKFLDRYGIDSHDWTSASHINNFSYIVFFMQVSDKAVLQKAIKWMKLVIEKQPVCNYLDTYASLLYKAGNKEEALRWEKLAFENAKQSEYSRSNAAFYESVIAKMEKGEKLNWHN